jgi:diguanylate cyclase (GGDEF)-like protein/PAS domain S-box-containing protein
MRYGLTIGPLHDGRRRTDSLWRKHAFAIRLASCFISTTLATVYVMFFERSAPTVNLIWVANGLLLTYLLLAPRWLWPGYLIAGFAGFTFGSILIGEPWQTIVLFNVLNVVEVLIGAFLLRRKSTVLPHFTDRRYLARFIGFAVLLGPIAAGGLLTLVMLIWKHTAHVKILLDWVIGDGLGTAVMVPTFAAIFRTRFRNSASLRKHWQYPLMLAAVAVAAFSQNKMPLFILVFPVLVLLLMRLGLGWAALSTLFIAAAASWYSIHGAGPFAIPGSPNAVESSIQLQFFVACCLLTIYLVSVILEERDSTEYRLQQMASIHSMVTDNSRDVILLADLDGLRTYVSPAVESLNGWRPEELVNQKLSEQVHPEDRAMVEESVRKLRQGSEETIIECRMRKRNGDYIWVESSLRLFRDRRTRIPAGVLSLVRDITERKHSEGLLLAAYKALEELAVVDALTGVANRRRFDEYLSNEWRRSARLQKPISLLLIDADSFKEHNDTHGHLSGDRCLKQIAEAAIEAAKRPEDLVARFGGDEFAVILPGADNHGAVELGHKIREVLKLRNPADDESAKEYVTVSVGCATAIPKQGEHSEALIQIADEALYKAKRNGRNQLCNGCVPPAAGATAQDGL